MPCEYLSGRTNAMKGDKTVWAKATKSGWDKRQTTIMLTAFADGVPGIPALIIYHGTEDLVMQETYYSEERKHYDPRVVVWFNKKGYAKEEVIVKWILTYLILPALNNNDRQIPQGPITVDGILPFHNSSPNASLIALDAAKFHKRGAVLGCLRNWDIIPSMIPGGYTGLIQPLDVSINGPFKVVLRDVLGEEMDKLGQEALNSFDIVTKSAVRQRRNLMTKCVGEAWARVS